MGISEFVVFDCLDMLWTMDTYSTSLRMCRIFLLFFLIFLIFLGTLNNGHVYISIFYIFSLFFSSSRSH